MENKISTSSSSSSDEDVNVLKDRVAKRKKNCRRLYLENNKFKRSISRSKSRSEEKMKRTTDRSKSNSKSESRSKSRSSRSRSQSNCSRKSRSSSNTSNDKNIEVVDLVSSDDQDEVEFLEVKKTSIVKWDEYNLPPGIVLFPKLYNKGPNDINEESISEHEADDHSN